MKTYKLIFLLFIFCFSISYAQNSSEKDKNANQQEEVFSISNEIRVPCGTDIIREEAFRKKPFLKQGFDKSIRNIQNHITKQKLNKSADSQYRIPVVVHVIHNGEPVGTGTNISEEQIQSQIDRLNIAFDNIDGGPDSAYTDITFCLAENGPNGSTVTWSGISGVNRIQDTQTDTGISSAAQMSLLNLINWPTDQYLNIWVVSTINGSTTGIVGYAPQPLTGDPIDGVVIQANVFGDNTGGETYNLLPNYSLGMSMVHEAGHYLGLYHTFQGASCSEVDCNVEGDMICDTPSTSIGSTCTTPICTNAQIENYMDYTVDVCKNTFTQGQVDWMHAAINTVRPNLISPDNLTLTGVPCAPPGLLASFTQTRSQICIGDSVTYTATTIANTATSYTWTFPGGMPSTKTGEGPHTITYNTAGDFDVLLETNDGGNNLVNTSIDAIYVTDCGGGITGAQAQWYFQSRCAIDFATGSPVGIIGSENTRAEGAASVCDANGNLEFYTDGYRAWNNLGNITNSLRTISPYESPAQGAVIVPDPGNTNNYYVFTSHGREGDINEGVRYSLYEGATQDFPTVLNQAPMINHPVKEHLAATPHCNGVDYWVIYRGAEGMDDKFLAYKVSTAGVSSTPVISNAFYIPPHPFFGDAIVGQIDMAPNGKWMAEINPRSETIFLYEINRANGQITQLTSTPYTLDSGGYGVSFSPNSEFLYVASRSDELRQYKVSNLLAGGNVVDFKSLTVNQSFSAAKSLQIGPDGKIYMNKKSERYLDVINYPNEEITVTNPNAIGYNDYGVFLPSNSPLGSRCSLPNMIDVPLGLTNADFDFYATNCGEVQFQNMSCGNQFSWDFGDGNTSTDENPSHTYSGPGTYTVTFTITTTLANGSTSTSTATETVTITLPPTTTIVGPQTVILPTPVNQFAQYTPSPLDPSLEYHWTVAGGTLVGTNPTDVAYVDWTSLPGTLTLTATSSSGCVSESIITVTESAKVLVSPKVFLQGALLNPNTGEETLMRDDLRIEGLLPVTSPYGDQEMITNNALTVVGANAIVDWIQVELRDETDNTTVVATRSALIQRDGDVVATDGVSPVEIHVNEGNYWVVIKHRNHLGIMTNVSIALSASTTILDFSDVSNPITFGTDAQTTYLMPSNISAMWAGDANADGRMVYSGALSDVLFVRNQVFNDPNNSVFGGPPVSTYQSEGYHLTDINMDGFTIYSGLINDTKIIRNNVFNNPSNSIFGGPPTATYVFTQQLPEGANN